MAYKLEVKNPLQVGDLMRAAELIAAVLDTLDEQTMKDMQSGQADTYQLGQRIITEALRLAPEAGQRFLAGLVDMKPEEFAKQPAEAVLEIAEQLAGRDDIAGFMKRARDLAERFTTSAAESSGSDEAAS